MKLRYFCRQGISLYVLLFPQLLIQSVLTDLKQVHSRINALSLFSTNEMLEDISTKDLVYLTIPFVLSEVENRIKVSDRDERIVHLSQVQVSSCASTGEKYQSRIQEAFENIYL